MTRLETLKAKLRAREGKSEYTKNCEALREEIARLEAGAAFSDDVNPADPERVP